MLNIAQVLDRSVEKWPNKTFLIFENREFTFRSFRDRVYGWVSYLREKGVKKGDIVAVYSKNRPEMMELWIAVCRLGAVYSPYNFNLKPNEIRDLVSDSKPVLIFSDKSLVDIGMEVIQFDGLEIHGKDQFLQETESDDVCTLLYTSGTESKPKGVMNTHLNWYSALISSIYDLHWQHKDTFLLSIPVYHVAGLYTFLGFLNVGAEIVLERIPNPSEIVSLIDKYKISYLIFPPTLYIALAQFRKEPLSSVKKCISFGAFISESQFDVVSQIFPEANWRNYYGMTETTPMGTTLQPEDFNGRKESIGTPHINVSIRIVKDDGKEAEIGEIGEMLISGPTVAKGYFGNEEKTKATFHDGWVHTGDLARRDIEGFIYFVDRKKDIIRTGGENVVSVEVEKEILSSKMVVEAAVVGIPHPYWLEAVTAFVTSRQNERIEESDLLEYLRQRMAGYKIPKKIVFLDSLPHNASGKILKRDIRETYKDLYLKDIRGVD
ncbi:MAG: class I adenylate-forming enzyme family protein [Thermoplasmataceae archaeon]